MDSELLKKIDNSFVAILWISEKEMTETSFFFNELNYLSDGLLEKNSKNLNGFFQGKSFDKPIVIGLIHKKPEAQITSSAESIISLINETSGQNIFLLHDNIESNLTSKFQKKFSKFKFFEYSPTKEIAQ
jgi:hypothetical protein